SSTATAAPIRYGISLEQRYCISSFLGRRGHRRRIGFWLERRQKMPAGSSHIVRCHLDTFIAKVDRPHRDGLSACVLRQNIKHVVLKIRDPTDTQNERMLMEIK